MLSFSVYICLSRSLLPFYSFVFVRETRGRSSLSNPKDRIPCLAEPLYRSLRYPRYFLSFLTFRVKVFEDSPPRVPPSIRPCTLIRFAIAASLAFLCVLPSLSFSAAADSIRISNRKPRPSFILTSLIKISSRSAIPSQISLKGISDAPFRAHTHTHARMQIFGIKMILTIARDFPDRLPT